MKIIFNFSNLRKGGALQVAHSVVSGLYEYTNNQYLLIVSDEINEYIQRIILPENISVYNYTGSLLKKMNPFLNELKKIEKSFAPDVVFSLFGPAYWKPSVPHVVGYARGHYIYKESPYFGIISLKERIQINIAESIHLALFKQESDALVSETQDVSDKIGNKLNLPSYFVSNTYNTVFNYPISTQKEKPEAFQLLFVAALYKHKNHTIIPSVIDVLTQKYKDFKFKFVLSIEENELPSAKERHRPWIDFIGRVQIEEVPALYKVADAMFLPTLLECFSASYAEAMKMGVPIITSDLSFAHTVCGDAAAYFDPMHPEDIADKIYKVYSNAQYRERLVQQGQEQLDIFLSADKRLMRYHEIMKEVIEKNK